MITTEYQYDNAGNLSRVTRAKGDATYERAVTYTFDKAGRLGSLQDWASRSTS